LVPLPLTRSSDALVLVAAFTFDLAPAVLVAGVVVFATFFSASLAVAFFRAFFVAFLVAFLAGFFLLVSAFALSARAPTTRDRRAILSRGRAPPSALNTSE